MLDAIRKMVNVVDRTRSLRRAMPIGDALKLAFAVKRAGHIRLYLKEIGREVLVRIGTSDLVCLEKVFIGNEYRSPFDISPRLIVDAGANVGMATIFFAHQYPDAKIVAIEPEPSNFAMLEQNCKGLRNVILIQGALWPAKRPLIIEDPASEAWTFAVTDRDSSSSNPAVSAVTIEDVLHRAGSDRIDLLKLDIEGSELQLFSEGAERWIDRVGVIAIELHDRYRKGCAQAFYSVVTTRRFAQEMRGENIFVKLTGERLDP